MKALLRKILQRAVRSFGAGGAFAAARQACKPLQSPPRVLLVHPGHMGAIVMTTPVLQALKARAPGMRITMLLGPWSKEVVARHPDVDEVVTCTFPSPRDNSVTSLQSLLLLLKVARQLRQDHYDMAINLRPRFWWGAALIYLARIPRRIGYAVEPCKPLITHRICAQAGAHFTVSYLRLASAGLQALGYTPLDEPYTPESYPLYFAPTQEERQWAEERLRREGIDVSSRIVMIHPGTGGSVKLWRPEAWALCADVLTRSGQGAPTTRIILTGSESELPLMQEVKGKMTARATMITNVTLGQLAALLQRAQLVLGVDSGPLHLATAQGTPTLRIFGPSSAATFGPWGVAARHAVVSSTRRCPTCPAIPCNRLDVRPGELASHPCVRLVSEQEILATIARKFPIFYQSGKDSLLGGTTTIEAC